MSRAWIRLTAGAWKSLNSEAWISLNSRAWIVKYFEYVYHDMSNIRSEDTFSLRLVSGELTS